VTAPTRILSPPATSTGYRKAAPVTTSRAPLPGKRISSLDSVRGLAALTVVFTHFLWFLKPDTPLRSMALGQAHSWLYQLLHLPPIFLFESSPLHILTAGHEAVVLFFVLSGFVIYLPWERDPGPPYRNYFIRRVCRIYLPYLAALFLAISLNMTLSRGGLPEMNAWSNRTWAIPVMARDVIAHLFMLGNYDTNKFLPPIWSLVHEMRISLLFPALAFVIRRSWALPVLAGLVVIGLLGDFYWGGPLNTDFATVYFAAFFLLGGLLAQRRDQIRRLYALLSPAPRRLLLVATFLLYVYGRFVFILWPGELAFPDLFIAVGAVGIIVWALSDPPCLSHPAVQWLGKVSYALYLIHFTVFLAAIYLFHSYLPIWLILTLALPVALVGSELFWNFVERPSIRLGHAMTTARRAF
jgi:peptidoglycan/LPS O-acetylase OafA/YrhL